MTRCALTGPLAPYDVMAEGNFIALPRVSAQDIRARADRWA